MSHTRIASYIHTWKHTLKKFKGKGEGDNYDLIEVNILEHL
jgi:hypothetical protein